MFHCWQTDVCECEFQSKRGISTFVNFKELGNSFYFCCRRAVLYFGVDELVAIIALYTLPELSDYRPLHPFLFKN